MQAGRGRRHLDPRLAEVVHDGHETRQDARVLAALQVRTQVGAHLAQRLARRPPHLRVLVLQTLRRLRSETLRSYSNRLTQAVTSGHADMSGLHDMTASPCSSLRQDPRT